MPLNDGEDTAVSAIKENFRLLKEYFSDKDSTIRLMEVCGSHTMAIAEAGIKTLLPENIRMVSGPGCPVCVTPMEDIDIIISLSKRKDLAVLSYGDLLRVPGSENESLSVQKARGSDVRIVYSPIDAVEQALAEKKEFIFVALGFETSAPGTASAILMAKEMGLKNFSILCLLKTTEAPVRKILEDPENNISGLLCPGHVATIVGEDFFKFIPSDYHIPAVIGGFDRVSVSSAVLKLSYLAHERSPELLNLYRRAVRKEGNPEARQILNKVFQKDDSLWRGLGLIENSGLRLKDEFQEFDAFRKFGLERKKSLKTSCRCGDILRGIISPEECPFFGKICTPFNPLGPCMVSSEGACSASFKYRDFK